MSPTLACASSPWSPASGSSNKRRRLPSLGSCGVKRRATNAATPQARRHSEEESDVAAAIAAAPLPFSVLLGAEGPYFVVAGWLNAKDLARTDAACRLLRSVNAQPQGPWQSIGDAAFHGMELDVGGGFFPFEGNVAGFKNRAERGRQNWKGRYKLFHTEAATFSAPFTGNEIKAVEHPDEVAYCRCRLRTDLLATRDDGGVYVEVEIRANADNLSLAVVDFEGGGRSSVTFSPETGAVLRERKVRESPRAIEGTYIHLLPAAPPGHRFEGVMGLYLRNGHLAFFRRWFESPAVATNPDSAEEGDAQGSDNSASSASNGGATASNAPASQTRDAVMQPADVVEPKWETTGFCTDLSWASGQRLSLCLAFRDDGQYHVRIARVGRNPPIPPPTSEAAYQEGKWNHLYGDDDHPLAI